MTKITETTFNKIAKAVQQTLDAVSNSAAVVSDIPIEINTVRNRHFFSLSINQSFGVFATVIAEAKITVMFEEMDHPEEKYWVNVSLTYEHIGGGRNGYNIVTIWLNEAFNVISYRTNDGSMLRKATA